MAKVKSSDVFEDDIFAKQIADASTFLAELRALEKTMKNILSVSVKGAKSRPLKGYENIQAVNAEVAKGKAAAEGLLKVQKEQAKVTKHLKTLTDEEVAAKIRYNEANKTQRQEIKDNIILESKETGTLARLAAQNRKLARERAGLNLETKRGQQRLIEINRQIDINNQKTVQSSDAMKKQKLNVGNYTNSIKDAVSSTGLFTREITILQNILNLLRKTQKSSTEQTIAQNTAQKGLNITTARGTKLLKGFKAALAATGIGALVLVVGSLVTMLTKTQSGMDSVERATQAVSTTFSVLIDRLARAGEGFKLLFTGNFSEGFAELKEAFAGITDEIAEEVQLVDELTRALQRLREQNAKLIVDEARIRAEVSKLRLKAEDDEKTAIADRVQALRDAFKLEKQLADEKIRLAKEQVIIDITGGERTKDRAASEKLINDIIAGRADLMIGDLGVANSTVEDLEAANRLIADVIGAQNEQYEKQRSLLRKINTLTNEQNRAEKKETPVAEAKKAEAEQLGVYLRKERELTAKHLTELENSEGASLDKLAQMEEAYNADVLALQIERITVELNNEDLRGNERIRKEKELNNLIIQQEKDRIAAEQKLTEKANAEQLASTEKQAEQQRLIAETSYAVTEALIQKSNAKRLNSIDASIQDSQQALASLEQSAELRSETEEQNIAFERKRQAELRAEREQELRRQKNLELGLAVARTYSAKVAAGDQNALSSTIADTAVLTAFISALPTAYTGTNDKTVGEVFGAPHLPGESKDQYIIRVDKDETILSPEKTAEYHAGVRGTGAPVGAKTDAEVVRGLKRVEQAITGRPEILGISYSDLTDAIVAKERRNNTISNRHIKTGNNDIFN